MTQQTVTANLLDSGLVVFLATDSGWTEDVAESFVSDSAEESDWLMAAAQRAVAARIVVDPYLIDVTRENGTIWPVKRREQIRAAGPTIACAPRSSVETLRRVA